MHYIAIIVLSLLSFTLASWLGNVNPRKISVSVSNGFAQVHRFLGVVVSVAGSFPQTNLINDEKALILTK